MTLSKRHSGNYCPRQVNFVGYAKLKIMSVARFCREDFNLINKPAPTSHKGDNGRLLVIGGSKLFHASIFWTADVASRFVDLVHFTSPAKENIDLVRIKMKSNFWQGIVVDWQYVETYIQEDDAIVIGPGMPREEGLVGDELSTAEIVNNLVDQYPRKHWIIDGGALQEVDYRLIKEPMILTPHQGEAERLLTKINNPDLSVAEYKQLAAAINNPRAKHFNELADFLKELSLTLNGVTILLKGVRDIVVNKEEAYIIEGGNEGLTKGGSGDVLAGLVGSFYTQNGPVLSAAAASFVLKHAADKLYDQAGPYYNTSDLVDAISYSMKDLVSP